MLFFLLSGRLPFVAATVKDFPKALRQEPDWAAMGGATPEAQQICRPLNWLFSLATWPRQMLQKEHQRPTAQSCLKDRRGAFNHLLTEICRWFVQMGLAGRNPAGVLEDEQMRSLLAVWVSATKITS